MKCVTLNGGEDIHKEEGLVGYVYRACGNVSEASGYFIIHLVLYRNYLNLSCIIILLNQQRHQ